MQEQRLQLDYQHRHQLLARVYRVAIVSSIVASVLAIILFEWPTISAIIVAGLFMVLGSWLVHRGQQRHGALLLLIVLALIVPLLAMLGEGSNDSALFFLAPMMVLAGLFFDSKAYWQVAFLLAIEIVLIHIAESLAWFQPTNGVLTPAILWSELAVILLAHFANCALINVVLSGVGLFVVSKTTRLAEQTAAWHRAAITDALTGLYNRRGFSEQADRYFRRALLNSTPVAALMIDVDHFKAINDSYGHDAGDIVIQHVAQQLMTEFRSSDIAGRWGGEEFCVLLVGVSVANARFSAERLRQSLARSMVVTDNARVAFTVSIGVACANVACTLPDLIKLADEKLYFAKENGRNTVALAELLEPPPQAPADTVNQHG
jgi:diguanylate cyclase (GGDEF)-like protein